MSWRIFIAADVEEPHLLAPDERTAESSQLVDESVDSVVRIQEEQRVAEGLAQLREQRPVRRAWAGRGEHLDRALVMHQPIEVLDGTGAREGIDEQSFPGDCGDRSVFRSHSEGLGEHHCADHAGRFTNELLQW